MYNIYTYLNRFSQDRYQIWNTNISSNNADLMLKYQVDRWSQYAYLTLCQRVSSTCLCNYKQGGISVMVRSYYCSSRSGTNIELSSCACMYSQK